MPDGRLDGIEKGMTPPPSTDSNIFHMTEEERKAAGIEMLPGSLEEAVAAFEGDPFIMDALGEHVYTKYLEAKKAEWDDYRTKISQWELENYLIKY